MHEKNKKSYTLSLTVQTYTDIGALQKAFEIAEMTGEHVQISAGTTVLGQVTPDGSYQPKMKHP